MYSSPSSQYHQVAKDPTKSDSNSQKQEELQPTHLSSKHFTGLLQLSHVRVANNSTTYVRT